MKFNKKILLILCVTLTAIITVSGTSCKKTPRNRVSLDQIENDNSNNYRFIFRDIIKEEREKASKSRDPFKH